MISLYASVRSPPAIRKFSTGNTAAVAPAGSLQANSNLSPPARNRSRSRSPATQRKANVVNNIATEPSQVSYELNHRSKFDHHKLTLEIYFTVILDGFTKSLATIDVSESTKIN